MLHPREMTAFRRDLKRLRKSRYDLAKLDRVVHKLIRREPLEARHKDHLLTGNWHGHRDCHITSDWVLIYKIVDDELWLIRTGSHSELF